MALQFSHEIGGTNLGEMIDEALEAEKFGYDVIWVPDHLVDLQPGYAMYDAWTILGFIGARTKRIKLGSGVTDNQRIHPAKLANIVSTLDNLTDGRAILGIGAGEIMNTKPYGIPWDEKEVRIEKLRESLSLIKLLWSSSYNKPVTWQGKFYALNQAYLSVRSRRRRGAPIYLGAYSSKKMLQIVAEIADGWYPGSMNPLSEFKSRVEVIKSKARSAGRRLDAIDIMAAVQAFVCSPNFIDKKRREIKKALKRELILNQHLLRSVSIKSNEFDIPDLKALSYQLALPGQDFEAGLRKAVADLYLSEETLDRAIDNMMAVGSPDDCATSIERFIKAGATHITFTSFLATRRNYELIAKKIIPLLKDLGQN